MFGSYRNLLEHVLKFICLFQDMHSLYPKNLPKQIINLEVFPYFRQLMLRKGLNWRHARISLDLGVKPWSRFGFPMLAGEKGLCIFIFLLVFFILHRYPSFTFFLHLVFQLFLRLKGDCGMRVML